MEHVFLKTVEMHCPICGRYLIFCEPTPEDDGKHEYKCRCKNMLVMCHVVDDLYTVVPKAVLDRYNDKIKQLSAWPEEVKSKMDSIPFRNKDRWYVLEEWLRDKDRRLRTNDTP